VSARCSSCGAEIPTLEVAWAAGLFEGEGSIRINKPTRRNLGALIVAVTNTDRDILNFLQARWPGYMKPVAGGGPRRKQAWMWVIAARRAMAFLMAIEPYVVRAAVRERIEFAVTFQLEKTPIAAENRTDQYAELQWNAYWWMAELNKRGVQVEEQHRRPA
jgi:hypothetical protein